MKPTFAWAPKEKAYRAYHGATDPLPMWGPFDTPDIALGDAILSGWDPDEVKVFEIGVGLDAIPA